MKSFLKVNFRDDTAHIDNELTNSDLSIQSIQKITDILKTTQIPIYPVLGNHDAFPHNQFQDDFNAELYQKTAEMWKSLGWPFEAYEDYKSNG